MPEQLTLPGFEAPAATARGRSAAKYKLFIALFPPHALAQRMAQLAEAWRQQHGLRTPTLQAHRLHVTLQVLGDHLHPPALAVVQRALAALGELAHPAVPTQWDQLLSFRASGALVLRCDQRSDQVIARLREAVQQALARQGVTAKPSNTPHITLLYDSSHVVPAHPVDPLCWLATDLALVLSHVGKHHHQALGRKTLHPPNVLASS